MIKTLKCSWCGRFVSYGDLRKGKAYHHMITPDSNCTCEIWETCCKECNEVNKK